MTQPFPATTRLPENIPAAAIAEDAVQAGFLKICEGLEEAGYPVTGDVDPLASHFIDQLFLGFVHMMALNNPAICALNDPEAELECQGCRLGDASPEAHTCWIGEQG